MDEFTCFEAQFATVKFHTYFPFAGVDNAKRV